MLARFNSARLAIKHTTSANKVDLLAQYAVRPASVTNVRYIQSKPRIEKEIKERYKAQLEARAKQKGLDSAEKLMEEMKETIKETKKVLNQIDPLKELEDYEQAMNLKDSLQGKKKKGLDPIHPDTPKKPYKTLESYLVVDKIKELSNQEIEFLWRAKFQSDPQSLIAVVPNETFEVMYGLARQNPTFVLPLPKEDAQLDEADRLNDPNATPMEVHFVQWSFVGPETTHCMITSLMEYKLHKEYARPHTTITFHQELAKDKDIVLMNGHVDKDAAITLAEAQMLLLNLQRFYGVFRTHSEIEYERIRLLQDFNNGSPNFSMEKCVKLSQTMEN